MKNNVVCEYVECLDNWKNNAEKEYIAEKFVRKGYGQTCGGYLKGKKQEGFSNIRISQKEHFLSYYGSEKKRDKFPSYSYLRCPQLLLFIAEIAGLQEEKLEEAYNIISRYEEENDLTGKEKDANYIFRECKFKEFKKVLQISMIVRIIKESNCWCEVKDKVSQL